MDGIYFLVLLAFGALTGALLALCAALGANPPSARRDGRRAGALMDWTDILSGALAAAIFLYLLFALFRPEKF